MANNFRDIDKEELEKIANEYCDNCIEALKDVPTAKGAIVYIRERKIPTIDYFLDHYIRRRHFDFYKRSNWYKAKNNPEHPLVDTIKKIDEMFKSLAVDIVANEGKGIFYAKNRLGMTDRVDSKNDTIFRLVDESTESGHKDSDAAFGTDEGSE